MQVSANGIALEVEDHGPPSGEPLVLIMGLGMQLVAWPDGFVAMLVARGFRVIRFDNRDIGLSQHFDHLGVPNVARDAFRHLFGLPVASPYSIADMANDTAALLDVLGLASAHVCGASMGGMVAQHLAARHAARVKSLTLMMTTTGSRWLPGPSLKVRAALLSRPDDPRSFDSIVEHYVRLYRLIGSPAYPMEEGELRQRVANAVRRSYHPQGVSRQLVAIAADGNRTPMLRDIVAPTQVIHGKDDPLVPVAAGHDLEQRIAGAQADYIDGMGHDLPAALWPRFMDGIARVAARR
jgi:pimeloyl-ACP methyl ester carboxylesterase